MASEVMAIKTETITAILLYQYSSLLHFKSHSFITVSVTTTLHQRSLFHSKWRRHRGPKQNMGILPTVDVSVS